jgi:hypothetical protein
MENVNRQSKFVPKIGIIMQYFVFFERQTMAFRQKCCLKHKILGFKFLCFSLKVEKNDFYLSGFGIFTGFYMKFADKNIK